GRAELDASQGSILSVLTNITALAAFPHVIAGAWLVAGAFLVGVASWHMVRHHNQAREADLETEDGQVHHSMARAVLRPTFCFAVGFILVAAVLLVITRDFHAKIMFEQQPMKLASA